MEIPDDLPQHDETNKTNTQKTNNTFFTIEKYFDVKKYSTKIYTCSYNINKISAGMANIAYQN